MSQSRQLAAIMFTDIVGYTALMGEDELAAFELLKKNRAIQRPIIEKFNGKWLKEIGDGVLASFSSVIDAVYCAALIQKTCENEPNLKLRIGIHLGDVIFEGNDVFGEGVNIASRLEPLAPIGGILVSESVHSNLGNKTNIQSTFVRKEQLKNVRESVKIYSVQVKGVKPMVGSKFKRELHQPKVRFNFLSTNLPIVAFIMLILGFLGYIIIDKVITSDNPYIQKPSIAVLPLINLNSSDENLEYFSDGVTQDIVDELSNIRSLFITAFTTTILYKGVTKDHKEIASELDVDYLIAGTSRIFSSGDSVRLSVELIDPISNKRIWNGIYAEKLQNAPKIQLSIARQITNSLNIQLTSEENDALDEVNTSTGEAFKLFLQAREEFERINKEESNNKFEYLGTTLGLDPNYAHVHTLYAWRNLSVPVFVVNPKGTLLFYNEAAENILGIRYEDSGEVQADQWSTMLKTVNDQGENIPPEKLPLAKTLYTHRPAYGNLWIQSLDGNKYNISITSYPIIGRSKKFTGAVAIFWTEDEKE